MFRGCRNIRLRTMLILVAGCATFCGLGVQVYRHFSPVQKIARQLRSSSSAMERAALVSSLSYTKYIPGWEREQAYRILLATVNDPDAQVRSVAAIALSKYREHAADVVPALIGLAKDDAPRVRESALLGLENLSVNGSSQANVIARAVIAALDDTNPAVRLEAGGALYLLGQGSRAVPAMARLVREEMGNYRRGGLGWLMAIKTIPADLKPTLQEEIATNGSKADRARANVLLYEATKTDPDQP